MNRKRRRRLRGRGRATPQEEVRYRPHPTGRVKTPLPTGPLLLSIAAHLSLAMFLNWSPTFKSTTRLPAVVTVDLVAALPQAATTAQRPAPKPAPAPPPKPKAPEKKVLPTPELQRKPKPKAKPKPKPKAKPEPPKQKPEPRQEKSLADVMADLRREEGSAEPSPAKERLPNARPDGRGEGRGVQITAQEAAWRRRAKRHVTRNWVLQPGFRRQLLETEVHVKLAAGGQVLDVDVARRSGNPWFDESVERAIRKSDPLPAPEKSGQWVFVFRPEDL